MKPTANPARLADRADGGGNTGALLRALGPARELSRREAAEIASHLDGLTRAGHAFRPRLSLAAAVLGLLLFGAFNVAFAKTLWPKLRNLLHGVSAPQHPAPPPIAPVPAQPEAEAPSPPPPEAAAPETLAPSPPPTSHLKGKLRSEADSLERALHALEQHNPQGALESLRTYHALFPRGALRREAETAELAADLELGKQSKAAERLGQLTGPGAPKVQRTAELLTLRGELLLQLGDSAGAAAVFQRALKNRPSPDVEERALYGAAASLGQLGQNEESQRFRDLYLTRFPDGRFGSTLRGKHAE